MEHGKTEKFKRFLGEEKIEKKNSRIKKKKLHFAVMNKFSENFQIFRINSYQNEVSKFENLPMGVGRGILFRFKLGYAFNQPIFAL